MEVLIAADFTYFVDGQQFPERGGIMLVSPPGNWKSTVIKESYKPYSPHALILSDVNVDTLNRMMPHMANGSIRTLALPAFEKIYERNPMTASNIEGHLKALVDEGFGHASFRDQRMLAQMEARCLVVGGCVLSCYVKNFSHWDDNGFTRRFIWSSFQLQDPELLTRAIHNWQRIQFEERVPSVPRTKIKMTVTEHESNELKSLIDKQGCGATPYALMKKILSVLKWKFNKTGEEKEPMKIMRDFGTSLGTKMAKLEM